MAYEVIASDEEEHSRTELREYPDRYHAVYLRRATLDYRGISGDEWYIRDSITIYKEK